MTEQSIMATHTLFDYTEICTDATTQSYLCPLNAASEFQNKPQLVLRNENENENENVC